MAQDVLSALMEGRKPWRPERYSRTALVKPVRAVAGRFRFVMRLDWDAAPKHGCTLCDETFPQTDDGWRALKTHEQTHNESGAELYDLRELDGLTGEVGVVELPRSRAEVEASGRRFELYFRATNGAVYGLPIGKGDTEWKWQKAPSELLEALSSRDIARALA